MDEGATGSGGALALLPLTANTRPPCHPGTSEALDMMLPSHEAIPLLAYSY
jgi:hypothetical protein